MNTSSPTKERFCGSFRQALGPSGCSCSPPDCPFQTAGGWFSWPEEGVQLRQGERAEQALSMAFRNLLWDPPVLPR